MADMEVFDVQRLALKPGDILAVRVRRRLTGEIHDRIMDVMTTALARAGRPDIPVIVTDDDIGFAVITPPEAG